MSKYFLSDSNSLEVDLIFGCPVRQTSVSDFVQEYGLDSARLIERMLPDNDFTCCVMKRRASLFMRLTYRITIPNSTSECLDLLGASGSHVPLSRYVKRAKA
ncbi:hypothetical protein DTL42_19580 [Bremerella cremea]|uniref:Uncharacterized protein n=1 Tax=Bremerella cremea TaxID=1031537 RepID=A0A368KM19_9BACT|nr:hypothetical protein DTL42_19580 [Bremerella cremea]